MWKFSEMIINYVFFSSQQRKNSSALLCNTTSARQQLVPHHMASRCKIFLLLLLLFFKVQSVRKSASTLSGVAARCVDPSWEEQRPLLRTWEPGDVMDYSSARFHTHPHHQLPLTIDTVSGHRLGMRDIFIERIN